MRVGQGEAGVQINPLNPSPLTDYLSLLSKVALSLVQCLKTSNITFHYFDLVGQGRCLKAVAMHRWSGKVGQKNSGVGVGY